MSELDYLNREKLENWFSDESCRTCECFQALLAQIELSGTEVLRTIADSYKVSHEEMHSCLGCDPCPPGEAMTEYTQALKNSCCERCSGK